MNSKEFIESGILENYVMGMASQSEQVEVEIMAAENPDIRQEIDAISDALESYAMENVMEPSPAVKVFFMATIDYTERLQSGEPMTFPPALNENSKVEDYAAWLNQPNLNFSGSDKDKIFAKIIGFTQEMTTAIVWLKENSPREIHHHELESFLIVEGTCDIQVGNKSNHLVAGDYFTIPLHEYHMVVVTSDIACKAILQRVAA